MQWLKSIFIGRARKLSDERLFHKISLVELLAWVGLGADGLSSSCYGPEETFKALGAHAALAPFVALACMATIAIICASYSQIIELFPTGGGGYLLASKLLSPTGGAGTYTGIGAGSHGLPLLRQPRVVTRQRTMLFIGASLALT